MLVTNTVMVKWNAANKKYYVDCGYFYTKMGDAFEVDITHLSKGSNVKVDVNCVYCKNTISTFWPDYNRYKQADGSYCCRNCAASVVSPKKISKTRLNKSMSFFEWCIQNKRWDYIDLFDEEKNSENMRDFPFGTKVKYYFKCPNGRHESELVTINNLTNESMHETRKIQCNQCNSLNEWCIQNNRQDIIHRWSSNNVKSPHEVRWGSKKMYYLNCPRSLHEPELKLISSLTINGQEGSISCNLCNSFAQCLIDEFGVDALSKYWSNVNVVGPWTITRGSKRTVYINCTNYVSHGYYKTSPNQFTNNKSRCPKCSESKGEMKISNWLIENNIPFIREKTFGGCVNRRKLPFDFAIFYDSQFKDLRCLIEYDGRQHFKPVSLFGGNKHFAYVKKNDKIKDIYCEENKIDLIRIPYWDFDNLEDILDNYFFEGIDHRIRRELVSSK